VHQAKYTKDILKKFKMDDSKPLSTPMSTTIALDADEDGEPVDQNEYRSMIGSLLYLTSSPLPFRFLVFRMPILRGVESIGSRLRGLVSFWYLRLFLGLLVNSLV
jgi:hypothetical protein